VALATTIVILERRMTAKAKTAVDTENGKPSQHPIPDTASELESAR
jgi:hypothetical protein